MAASLRLGWSWADALDAFVVTNAVMGLAFGGCGVIMAWHRPGNAIGWLFATGGLLQAVAASDVPGRRPCCRRWRGRAPVERLLATVFVYSWPWAIGLCVPLALLLFPDGRPVCRAWRPVVVAVVVTAPLFVLEMAAAPEPVGDGGAVAYLTLPFYDQLRPFWAVRRDPHVGGLPARLRRPGRPLPAGRRAHPPAAALAAARLGVVIVALLLWGLVADAPVAVLLAVPLIPVAVTVAIVRYRLLDIRLVVSRALAWLLLSLAVVVAYVALVAGLDRLISSQIGRSAAATVLLVLLAAPVLPRLQRFVDRAMYGDRANPARVVSQLGAQLAQPMGDQGPEAGLARVAASIRQALRLPYVALERDGEVLAADGRAGPRTGPARTGAAHLRWRDRRRSRDGPAGGRAAAGRSRTGGCSGCSPRPWPSRCTPRSSRRSCRPLGSG